MMAPRRRIAPPHASLDPSGKRGGIIRHLRLAAALPGGLLLLLVLLTPLPFGGVMPLERSLMQIGAFLALALSLADRDAGGTPARPAWVASAALAAVGLFGIVQALPWPRFAAGLLWSRGVLIHDTAAGVLGDPAAAVPLSLAPAVSRATGLHWLAIAAAFLAAARIGRFREVRRLLALGVVAVAAFEIVYGAEAWFRKLDTIWGIQVPGDVRRLRGTFVNPDHCALFLALALAVCFAWTWWALRRLGYRFSLERRLAVAAPPCLLFLTLFVGLSFTGSRAALAAVVVVLLAQTLLLAGRKRNLRMAAAGIGALAVGFAGVVVFGLRAGLGRWLDTSAYELATSARLDAYRATLSLWWQLPFTGSGLGTYRQALPLVQEADLPGTWTHAHNDYLELLATTGLVGLPVLLFGLFVLGRRLLQVYRYGRRSEDRAAGLAALGALLAAALMSAVDFGLTMPANALALAVICGLACGPRTFDPRSAATEPGRRRRRKRSVRR